MSIGAISISTSQKKEITGPFALGSARNGASIDGAGLVVLGNDVGAVGNPAQLLSQREILMHGFSIFLKDTAVEFTELNGGIITTVVPAGTNVVAGDRAQITLKAGNAGDIHIGDGVNSIGFYMTALSETVVRGNNTEFIDYMGATNSTRIGRITLGLPGNGSAVQVIDTFTFDKYLIVPSTGVVAIDDVLDGGKVFTNQAGASTFTMPLAASITGFSAKFCVQQAANLTLQFNAADTVNIGGTVSSAGGTLQSSTVGSFIEITVIADHQYVVNGFTGLWSVT